jgi:DNA (cytosine-5)-methyltransferase 1
LRVIDFFCGAGGFSEGFRQQGFDIAMGIDSWALAIQTHNINNNLTDKPKDVLIFGSSLEEIDQLPDAEIIVGSPPCVLFSLSNKGGKADKTLGIRLIEAFLRVVAVKKHQKSSRLVAWFMENVPNSKNYISPTYTFRQLHLEEWAKAREIDPDAVALNAANHGKILNTADFGTPQRRERFLCGEIVASGNFPDLEPFKIATHRTVSDVRSKMPKPNLAKSKDIYVDPNYPSLALRVDEITDHFYDSGIYESQWRDALWLKTNHPYMGKMSFPENENKPSRTIMATQSAISREALIYKSEYNRNADGAYRLPTIREVATLMGFPYSYQFAGGESSKWRQIGNAVCPHLSSVLAKSVRFSLGLETISDKNIPFPIRGIGPNANFHNLNTFIEDKFTSQPKKNPKAKFRRHPFKDGNMTVALTNFNPTLATKNGVSRVKWYSVIYSDTGNDFKVNIIRRNRFKQIGKIIQKHHHGQGKLFLDKFETHFQKAIGCHHKFQDSYTGNDLSDSLNPRALVDKIAHFILQHEPDQKLTEVPAWVSHKQKIPTRQVFAIYAINRLAS